MQNTAISFSVCVDAIPERLEALLGDLQTTFSVKADNDLELITVRHYIEDTLHLVKRGKVVLLEEHLRGTAQLVVKPVPTMERIR